MIRYVVFSVICYGQKRFLYPHLRLVLLRVCHQLFYRTLAFPIHCCGSGMIFSGSGLANHSETCLKYLIGQIQQIRMMPDPINLNFSDPMGSGSTQLLVLKTIKLKSSWHRFPFEVRRQEDGSLGCVTEFLGQTKLLSAEQLTAALFTKLRSIGEAALLTKVESGDKFVRQKFAVKCLIYTNNFLDKGRCKSRKVIERWPFFI
jgi:hypothetical protein